MKKIQFPQTPKDKYWHLCQNVFDLNDQRFMIFRQYLIQAFEHIDESVFEAVFNEYLQFHNEGRHAEGLIALLNFKKALEMDRNKMLKENPMSMCYALICLRDEDEDQTKVGSEYLSEKLKEMRAEGLTRGEVEKAVINFTAESPISFGDSSPIWQGLREMIISSESEHSENSTTTSPEKPTPSSEQE